MVGSDNLYLYPCTYLTYILINIGRIDRDNVSAKLAADRYLQSTDSAGDELGTTLYFCYNIEVNSTPYLHMYRAVVISYVYHTTAIYLYSIPQ